MKKIQLITTLSALLLFSTISNSFSQTLGFTELAHGEISTYSSFLTNTKWIDYDNDGDLDIYYAIGGKHGFFINNGTDVFVKSEFGGSVSSYIKYTWADIDMDDDLDLIHGSKRFINDGSGNFLVDTIQSIAEYDIISTDLGDFDNDGDLDMACVLRYEGSTGYFGKILYNNSGTFSKPLYEFPAGSSGTIKFMDLKKDKLLDLVIQTRDTVFIYSNIGHEFKRDTAIKVSGYFFNKLEAVDIDEDFDNDIISARRIIRNDYPEFHVENNFLNVYSTLTLEAGDVDNDGDTDFLYAYNSNNAELYLKDAGGYTEAGLTFPTLQYSNPDFGDYDQDGDLDFVASYNSGGSIYLSIFRNDLNTANTAPSAPGTLTETVLGNKVTFSWTHGSDTESIQDNLSYNIHVNLSGSTYFGSNADFSDGFLRKNYGGNVGKDTCFTIEQLAAGSYTWSVQTIDPGYLSSPFTSSGSFSISRQTSLSPIDHQILKPNEVGTIINLTENGSFSSRYWVVAKQPGGPYEPIGNTGFSYKPDFSQPGDYYIRTVSTFGSDSVLSNEVHVSCLYFEEIEEPFAELDGLRSLNMVDFDNDGDYDLLTTADGNNLHNLIYEYDAGTFIVHAGFNPRPVETATSVCFDFNNDGWIDILLSGQEADGSYSSILYQNNENLSFDSIAVFVEAGVIDGSIAAGDYDNDGLKDFIISGLSEDNEAILKVFKNFDNGSFIEQSIALPPITNGTVKLEDLNSDGFLDIFLTGSDISGNPATFMYKNTEDGAFQKVNENFIDLRFSNADFADYNNDGYLDILLGGETPEGLFIYLYTSIDAFLYSDTMLVNDNSDHNIATWFDQDNDGDLDILLSSDNSKRDYASVFSANLLLENFNGNFIKNPGYANQMNLRGTAASQVVKYDSDSDVDLLQMTYDPVTKNSILYALQNLSTNIKTLPPVPDGLQILQSGGNVRFTWNPSNLSDDGLATYNLYMREGSKLYVSGDADTTSGFRKVNTTGPIKDTVWVIKGLEVGNYIWKVQAIDNSLNYSAFSTADTVKILDQFIINTKTDFEDYSDGGVSWGDFDNDGDLDILMAGESASGVYTTKVYRNDGGIFTDLGLTLTGVYANASMFAEWIDLNKDNWLDIALYGSVVTGSTPTGLYLYENNQDESFTLQYSNEDLNFSQKDGAYGDLDNDGDIDFTFSPYTVLTNEGNFSFTSSTLNNVYGTHVDIIDLENDLDYDINALNASSSRLMINSGGSFPGIYDLFIPLQSLGEVQWLDYNNDQYIDMLVSGSSDQIYKSAIFRNNKDSTFTEINTILKAGTWSNVCFGDYENDGDFDFFISGKNTVEFAELYINNSYTRFLPIQLDWPNIRYNGKSRMGDFDNDGDLDLMTTGENSTDGRLSLLFENTQNYTNTPASAPANLFADREDLDVILYWDEAIDNESVDGGLSYNVRVGTTPGGTEIVSPMSDLSNGYRRVALPGNAQYSLAYRLNDIPVGTYYWSVQAVDHGFMGGAWAVEDSFSISDFNVDFSFDEVCLGLVTTFNDLTVSNGVTISHWDWDFDDGTVSTEQYPDHLYTSAGTFQVKLVTSYMDGGVKTAGDSITKMVTVLPKIISDFSASTACLGSATTFSNDSEFNGLTANTWEWNFDDGNTSSIEAPGTNGYLSSGDYNVFLKVESNNGCLDSITKLVQVAEIPETAITANAPLSFCSGDSVTLSVEDNSNYTYSWKLNGTPISSANNYYYSAKVSGSYTVEVTNPIGACSAISAAKVVTVNSAPLPSTISSAGPTSFCMGDSLTLSVPNSTGYSYQWLNNGAGAGLDQNTFTAHSSGDYTVEVTNSLDCSTLASDTISITVNPVPSTPNVTVNGFTDFCEGDTVKFSTAYDPALNYQWKNGTLNINSATSNEYAAISSGDYNLQVTNSFSCTATTEEFSITVFPTPSAPAITVSGDTVFCVGDSTLLSVSANASLEYEWFIDGGSIGDPSNEIYVYSKGNYTLQATNSNYCTTASSNSINISVSPTPAKPSLSTKDGNLDFCEGDTLELYTDLDPLLSYQWLKGGNNIGGANSASFKVLNSGLYKLAVMNAVGCGIESEAQAVNLLISPPALSISASINDTEFCENDTLILSVSDNPDYTYTWLKDEEAIGVNANFHEVSSSGVYTLSIMSPGGCETLARNSFDLTIYDIPTAPAVTLAGSTSFCEGETAILTVSNPGTESYQWMNLLSEVNGETASSLVVNKTGTYRVRVENEANCAAYSPEFSIVVNALPEVPIVNTKNYIKDSCVNIEPVELYVSNSEAAVDYQWLKSGEILANDTLASYEAYLDEGTYKVRASINNCFVESEAITIAYQEMPDKPDIISEGPNFWYLACTNISATEYKWYYNDNEINGAKEYIYPAGSKLGKYQVSVSENGSCHSISDPVWIPESLGTNIETDPWAGLKIYPNPTPGLFTLEMDNAIMGELNIDIINERGAQILNIKFRKETNRFMTQIDLSGQPSALYMISLMLEEWRTTRSLVVE